MVDSILRPGIVIAGVRSRMGAGRRGTLLRMPVSIVLESVVISDHAVARYQERVRPGLDEAAARAELERLRAVATVVREAPAWLHAADQASCYLLLGDDVVLPLLRRSGGGWVASTCVAKSTMTVQRRAAKTARRKSLGARGRARRRAPS